MSVSPSWHSGPCWCFWCFICRRCLAAAAAAADAVAADAAHLVGLDAESLEVGRVLNLLDTSRDLLPLGRHPGEGKELRKGYFVSTRQEDTVNKCQECQISSRGDGD